jgi:hypothetical protein
MKKVIVLVFSMICVSSLAQTRHEVLVSAQNEQFISMKFSEKSKRLFVTTNKGQMIVLNDKDNVIDTLTFSSIGNVDLDDTGNFGAYSDGNYNVFIFNQKTLRVVKILQVTHQQGQGAMRVVFSRHGVLFSTFMNVYKLDSTGRIANVAPSFGILDYDSKSDVILLGKWDSTLRTDRKVKELYLSSSKDITVVKHIFSTPMSFELYSYLLNNSNTVMTYDGRGNYYVLSLDTNTQFTESQTELAEQERKFGLAKVNDSTIMYVSRSPLAFNFHSVLNRENEQSVFVRESVVNNQIARKNYDIYYLTSGGNGNKLIAIK